MTLRQISSTVRVERRARGWQAITPSGSREWVVYREQETTDRDRNGNTIRRYLPSGQYDTEEEALAAAETLAESYL